jgi:hypothetical protein
MAHAEKFSEVLEARERGLTERDTGALWLMGRAGELRCVAEVLNEGLREGRLSPGQAAVDLALHLDVLHAGFARFAGVAMPPCCREQAELTPTVLLRNLSSPLRDRQ